MVWEMGGALRPVNKCLMTTGLGAAATTSSCCLFRENELSTERAGYRSRLALTTNQGTR